MKNPLLSMPPFESIRQAVTGQRPPESKDPFLQEYIVDVPPDEENPESSAVEIVRGQEKIGRSAVKFKGFVPEKIKDEVPLYLNSGWLCPEEILDELGEEIAKRGKAVFLPSRESSLRLFGDLHPANLFDPVRALSQGMRATLCGADRIAGARGLDNSRVDIAGFSLGSHPALETAKIETAGVRSLTLMAPPGLQDHKLPDFLGNRIPSFLINELIGQVDIRDTGKIADTLIAARGIAKYVGRAPHKALGEGIVAGSTDLRPKIKTARQSGTKIAIVGALEDRLLPIGETARQSRDLTDRFSVLPAPYTGHLFPFRHSRQTAQVVRKVIDDLFGQAVDLTEAYKLVDYPVGDTSRRS